MATKKKPFKNAPKVVFYSMATAARREMMTPDGSHPHPEEEEYEPPKNQGYRPPKNQGYRPPQREEYRPPRREENVESRGDILKQIQIIEEKLQNKKFFIEQEEEKSKYSQRDLDWYLQELTPLEKEFQEEHRCRKILDEEISKCKEVLGDFVGTEVDLTEEVRPTQSKRKQAQRKWALNDLDDFGEVEDLKKKNLELEELLKSNVELAAELESLEKESEPLEQEVAELTRQLDVLMEAAKGQFQKDTENSISEPSNVCEEQTKPVQKNKKATKKKRRH